MEINSGLGIKNPKNIVLANLLSEIYKKQNTSLMDRAQNASLGVVTAVGGPNSQSMFVSGYTTKHQVLIDELLTNFVTLKFSQAEFNEALEIYKQNLANNNKNPVFRQLYGHLGRLTNQVQWRDDELLLAAEKVKQKDVIAYYGSIKRDPLIRILAVGNYTEESVKQMALSAAKILPGKRLPNARVVSQYTTPTGGSAIELKESLDLADSAVMQVWFREKKSDDEHAQLVILNALLDKAFFTQLRTNEQLGYVVQSLPYPVDDMPGYAMMVQSSNSDLGKIKARMDKFRADYLAELKAIEPARIEQTKQALMANITQKPTDFYKEASIYAGEFWHAKYDFDGRDRHLNALKMVTKEDLIKMYETLLLNDKNSGILLQIRGTNSKDAPFAPLKP